MNVLVAGGTGFIGSRLIPALEREEAKVTILTRTLNLPAGAVGRRYVHWDGRSTDVLEEEVRRADVVVNLSGASIGSGRWTARRKRILRESRILTTQAIVNAIGKSSPRPSVLVNMSAVGFYGECGDEPVTEGHLSGSDFLSTLCREWEEAAMRAAAFGVRVLIPRMAVVIASGGGVMTRFLLPYRLFLGGALGQGTQWFPWVHIDDAVEAILFAIRTATIEGAFNVVSPGRVTMTEFATSLGQSLHRPHFFTIPAWMLSLALGEMAQTILVSQKVLPQVLLRQGFQFQYSPLQFAFDEVFAK